MNSISMSIKVDRLVIRLEDAEGYSESSLPLKACYDSETGELYFLLRGADVKPTPGIFDKTETKESNK